MYKAAIIASAIASAAAGVIDLENISFEDHVEHHALTFKGALSGDSVNSSLTMSSNVCETIMPLEGKFFVLV